MVSSVLLRDVASAVERYEIADTKMRGGWPQPKGEIIHEWNAARRAAETMLKMLRKEL